MNFLGTAPGSGKRCFPKPILMSHHKQESFEINVIFFFLKVNM